MLREFGTTVKQITVQSCIAADQKPWSSAVFLMLQIAWGVEITVFAPSCVAQAGTVFLMLLDNADKSLPVFIELPNADPG